MTKLEREIVRRHIESVFGDWHACRLKEKDAKEMGLKTGRLCDMCRDSVAAEMKSIRIACGE